MIVFADIKVDDVLKVLVKDDDDMEEEMYAVVNDCFLTTLTVRYYSPTSLLYKRACLYELEDEVNPILFESITEHYIEGSTPFLQKDEMFYLESEVDSQCSDSEVEDMSDDDELDDFVVPDEPMELPPDHREIDAQWDSWVPSTSGARNFKNVVNRLEQQARLLDSELRF